MDKIVESYLIKKGNEDYATLASRFDGLRVLSMTGFLERGKPVNVYTAQWLTSGGQTEDFMITTKNSLNEDEVIYENSDIEITFIIGTKYSSGVIDVRRKHDEFIEYMTSGKLSVKSLYTNEEVECVCLEKYNPTTVKLQRGATNTWIMGTIKLHQLTLPSNAGDVHLGDHYIGFGTSSISTVADIEALTNVQYYNREDISGSFSISTPSVMYLWICTNGTLAPDSVSSSGFRVPITTALTIGDFRCYRSGNSIAAGVMDFKISTN